MLFGVVGEREGTRLGTGSVGFLAAPRSLKYHGEAPFRESKLFIDVVLSTIGYGRNK